MGSPRLYTDEERRARKKVWLDANRERVREYTRECERRRAAKRAIAEGREPGKIGRPAIPVDRPRIYFTEEQQKEAKRERARKWWHKHNRERYQADPSKILDANREWRRKNREIVRDNKKVSEQRRRAKARETGGSFTRHDIDDLFVKQNGRCPNCRSSFSKIKYEIDHIIPLALGGSNAIENIQLLCHDCNRLKGAKDPLIWARENNRLL